MEPNLQPTDKKMFYKHLIKSSVYFEYGSGGSTYKASIVKNIKKIYSVESDSEWHDLLKQKIQNNNVNFIYNDINTQENFKKINELFEKIEQGKTLSELLKNSVSGTGVHVFIGADNKLFDYSGCSMILAPIKAKSTINKTKTLGAIGVIGPMRVNYGRIIPMVDFTAKAISKLFK